MRKNGPFTLLCLLALTTLSVANASAQEKSNANLKQQTPKYTPSVAQLQDNFRRLKLGMFITDLIVGSVSSHLRERML